MARGISTYRFEGSADSGSQPCLDHPLWLHFLPLDVRRACGLSKRLKGQDQLALLRWTTLMSAVVAKDFCVINPGTIEESEITTALLADLFPLIESGLIRFSMKERDFLEHREKKEREYRLTHDSYGSFNSYDIYTMLNEVARVYPRSLSIGDTIADRFGDDEFFRDALDDFALTDVENAAQHLREAAIESGTTPWRLRGLRLSR